jgi:hypothetical protein
LSRKRMRLPGTSRLSSISLGGARSFLGGILASSLYSQSAGDGRITWELAISEHAATAIARKGPQMARRGAGAAAAQRRAAGGEGAARAMASGEIGKAKRWSLTTGVRRGLGEGHG